MTVAALTIAALIAATVPQTGQDAPPQDRQDGPQAVTLDDVIVEGRASPEAASRFVDAVAAPTEGRGLALWRDPICVGVANLQPEVARAMADRVLDWAHSMNLSVGDPGCDANVLVVATDDGDRTAREMVSARPRDFRPGVSGADLGGSALRAFQRSGRPVRWWHVSLPVARDTGAPLGRLPGQEPVGFSGKGLTRPQEFGENSTTGLSSRLSNSSRDDLKLVIIVVDTTALDTATFAQLSDYVAMVALAQIAPDVQTSGFDTILSLFETNAAAPDTLTDWDRAFLNGLYAAHQESRNSNSNRDAVADAMRRSLSEPPTTPDR